MIINDLDDYYIVFDTKNRNIELDTLPMYISLSMATNWGIEPYSIPFDDK